jgi:hypothetical protein
MLLGPQMISNEKVINYKVVNLIEQPGNDTDKWAT